MIIAFYNEDGDIITVKSGPNKDDLLAGADPDLKYIETETQPDIFNNYVNDDGVQTIPDQPSPAHEWDKEKKAWHSDNASLMRHVRKIRDSKLQATDYTQVADIPFGQSKKNKWVQYRQKLRDLPSEFPDAYLPEHITWPDPPQD